MILVKFDDNYADEFDTQGFMVMTQSELDRFLSTVKSAFIYQSAMKATPYKYHCGEGEGELVWDDKEVEQGFGTNEGWVWVDYEDFISSLEFSQIKDVEIAILKKHFPEAFSWGYGMFPTGMGDY